MQNDMSQGRSYLPDLHTILNLTTMAIGIGGLIGWLSNSPRLLHWGAVSAPMQFNTALCMVLLTTSFLASGRNRRAIASIFSALAGVIALLTLTEYAAKIDLWIDQVFIQGSTFILTGTPGRMAPNSALCISLLSFSALSLGFNYLTNRIILLIGFFSSLSLVIAATAMSGYIAGIHVAYGWGHYYPMGIQTAIGCILLSSTALLQLIKRSGGLRKSLRFLLPIGAGAALFALTLLLWQALSLSESKKVLQASLDQAISIREQVELALNARVSTLVSMASRLSYDQHMSEGEWRADAVEYRKMFPDYLAMGVQDSDYATRWVEAGEKNKLVRRLNLNDDPTRKSIADAARKKHGPVISSTLDLRLGGKGFLIMAPIYHGSKFNGFVSVGLRVADFFSKVVESPDYELKIVEGKKELFSSTPGQEGFTSEFSASTTFSNGLALWTIRAAPKVEMLQKSSSLLPPLALVFGTIFSVLLSLLIELLMRTRDQSRSLELRVEERTKMLHAREQETRMILDNSPAAISMHDVSGKILMANRQFQQIFGNTNFVATNSTELNILSNSNDPIYAQQTLTQDDGVHHYISVKFPIHNEAGEIRAICTISTDTTVQKRAENERLKFEIRERSALESSRLKSEFLANMSHEIRTPLNGIIGMISLLSETSLSAEQSRFTKSVAKSSDLLLTLINDILDLSKVEAGKLELEVLPFCLDSLVREVGEAFTPLIELRGLDFKTCIRAGRDRNFFGDRNRIRQILNNLLSNAIKFTPKGSVSLQVDVLEKTGNRLEIEFTVSDSGIGISTEAFDRLFRNFSQGESSTAREYGGTGLGLAICKRLVDLMGGTIGVKSDEGQGSTFHFSIALLPASETSATQISDSQFKTSDALLTRAERQVRRILVAEDNAINLEITLRMLSSAGYQSDSANNGIEAIKAVEQNKYDLIIMDCQMPEMDGYQASLELRARGIDIPILALTANAYAMNFEKCREFGMSFCITKPIYREMLISTVDRLVTFPGMTEHRLKHSSNTPDQIIDLSILRRLETCEGESTDPLIPKLVRMYVDLTPRRLAELRQSIVNPALDRSKIAHDLKSSCANLGAQRATAILQNIEDGNFASDQFAPMLDLLDFETQLAQEQLLLYLQPQDAQL